MIIDNLQSNKDTSSPSSFATAPQYLPTYIFGTYSSGSSQETGIESPMRCQLVTERNEHEGLTELVVMDTGIQSSAPENEEHLIEDI